MIQASVGVVEYHSLVLRDWSQTPNLFRPNLFRSMESGKARHTTL